MFVPAWQVAKDDRIIGHLRDDYVQVMIAPLHRGALGLDRDLVGMLVEFYRLHPAELNLRVSAARRVSRRLMNLIAINHFK